MSTHSSYHDPASELGSRSHNTLSLPPPPPSTDPRRTVSISAESFEAVIALLRDTFEHSGTPVDEAWLRGVAERTLRASALGPTESLQPLQNASSEAQADADGDMGGMASRADPEGGVAAATQPYLPANGHSDGASVAHTTAAATAETMGETTMRPASPLTATATGSKPASAVGVHAASPPTPIRETLATLCRNAARGGSERAGSEHLNSNGGTSSSWTDAEADASPPPPPRWLAHGFTFPIPPPDAHLADLDTMRVRALESSLDTLAQPYHPRGTQPPKPPHRLVRVGHYLLSFARDSRFAAPDLDAARSLIHLFLDVLVAFAMLAPAFATIAHLPSFIAFFPFPMLMWLRHLDSGIDGGALAVLSFVTCAEALALVVVGAGTRSWDMRKDDGVFSTGTASDAFRIVAAGYALHAFLYAVLHAIKYTLYPGPLPRRYNADNHWYAGETRAHYVFSVLLEPLRVVADSLALTGPTEGIAWPLVIGALATAAATQTMRTRQIALLFSAVAVDAAVAVLRRVLGVLRAETAQRRADALANLSRVFHRLANDLEDLKLDAFEEQVERVYAVIAALPDDDQRLYVDEIVETTQLPVLKVLVALMLEVAAANRRRLEVNDQHLRSLQASLFVECAVDVHRRFGHLRRRLYRLSPDIRRQAELDLRPWINWADEWETSWSIYEKCRVEFPKLQKDADDSAGTFLDWADGEYYCIVKGAAFEPFTLLKEPQYPSVPSPFDHTENANMYTARIERGVVRWTSLTVTVLVIAIVLFVVQIATAYVVWPSTHLWVSLFLSIGTVFLLWRLLYVNYTLAKVCLVEVFLYGAFHSALFEFLSVLLLLCLVVLLRGVGNALVADVYISGIRTLAEGFTILAASPDATVAERLGRPLTALAVFPPFSVWYKIYTPNEGVYTYAAQAIARAAERGGLSLNEALAPLLETGDVGGFARLVAEIPGRFDSGTHVLFPCAGIALFLLGLRTLVLLGPRWPAGLQTLAGIAVAGASAATLRRGGEASTRLRETHRLLPVLFAIFLAVAVLKILFYARRCYAAYAREARAERLERARERANAASSA